MSSETINNVYVIGVFDLFHRGHVELLRRSKELGKNLIVAINGDDMVASYKRAPYFSEQDRLEIIKACRYVDEAFIIDGYDNKQYLVDYDIDAIVHGDDWEKKSYMEQIRVTEDFLNEYGIELVLLPYTEGISTSDLISTIRNCDQ
ncbi:MAG: adenylyltransferase/cytidyltransferase family protein [Bacteroidota bacterium]